MNDYAFGNFLYTLRTEKGLSQTQLAGLLGVTNKAVSKWENGASKPNTVLIPKLAQILEISVEELFAGRRFEKNTELEQIKAHLAKQKKKDAVLASVFLAVAVILPLLLIEFICIMMVFQIPDDVVGPLGAMVLILTFIASLVAFIIYRSNYRHIWTPSDMILPSVFVSGVKFGILLCVIALPSLLVITIAMCNFVDHFLKNPMAGYIVLSVAGLIVILVFGTLICLLNIKALLKIRVVSRRKDPVPFREKPLWVRVYSVVTIGLFPLVLCFQFSGLPHLKYGSMLIWITFNLVAVFSGIWKDN